MAGSLPPWDKERPQSANFRREFTFSRENLNLGWSEESPRWHPTPKHVLLILVSFDSRPHHLLPASPAPIA